MWCGGVWVGAGEGIRVGLGLETPGWGAGPARAVQCQRGWGGSPADVTAAQGHCSQDLPAPGDLPWPGWVGQDLSSLCLHPRCCWLGGCSCSGAMNDRGKGPEGPGKRSDIPMCHRCCDPSHVPRCAVPLSHFPTHPRGQKHPCSSCPLRSTGSCSQTQVSPWPWEDLGHCQHLLGPRGFGSWRGSSPGWGSRGFSPFSLAGGWCLAHSRPGNRHQV